MSCEIIESVQELLGRNYDPDISLDPFIAAANALLARHTECASSKGITLTAEETRLLTMYLAAHFYGSTDQFYTSRSTGRASGTYMGETGLGLDGTLYGQNAKLIDPTNCLAAMDRAKITLRFEWLGTPYREQRNYWER